MRFLLVDDEPLALQDLEDVLREAAPGNDLLSFSFPSSALALAKTEHLDLAFLDIELGSINGLVFAKNLKDLQPHIHIIFVTSYRQYAVDAFALHATGYLMKPVMHKDVLRELTFIYGNASKKKSIRVQTFGGFSVFVNEYPLKFGRAKSKELFAILVDRQGIDITTAAACAILWEDDIYNRARKNYFQIILSDLRTTLRKAGIEDILIHSRNSLAINPNCLDCDSYRFMNGDPQAINAYRHDYMCCYSWAEFTLASLDKKIFE